jgi:hypothetical protein
VFLVATFATMESTSIVISIISFALTILIIPNLVVDVVLAREGGTKGGRTKLGKAWA